jgi:hypothetical protein
MRVLKVIDAPWFKIIDGTGAFSTASAKLRRNRRFRSNYLGHAHPKHVVKQGKTPVLTADEAKQLLASIIPEKKLKTGTPTAWMMLRMRNPGPPSPNYAIGR